MVLCKDHDGVVTGYFCKFWLAGFGVNGSFDTVADFGLGVIGIEMEGLCFVFTVEKPFRDAVGVIQKGLFNGAFHGIIVAIFG